MPQLDTSTWSITILSTFISLFTLMQLKLTKHNFITPPTPKTPNTTKHTTPWEMKWTKTYSPLS
ncbi:ATP synthase F0 subunit 8 (mitochondrion) [Choloepus didactylus]|uniref:ATP synthase complex subunit 8 n=1 Tax=Choloepus didactylus TaxID=27675 RepID=Q58F77_CHODI|nr:ATP synthase F0 subunit 8 [Choloepus didactylus]AAX50169.1 ATPase8 [Choloepus didactylus]ALF62861.1 ATP synthase F0 subunit 8 [Choloepus didactylus]ALO62379.1 ATP synthase F0 subunit 8 [Choloepus didactylus]